MCVARKSTWLLTPKLVWNSLLRDCRIHALKRKDIICTSITMLLFVEIFSGEGKLCKAMARLGYHIVAWDIVGGAQFDLDISANRQSLLRLVGSADMVHLGPPCSSFSIARRSAAPRSRQFPWGKPGLCLADQLRVDHGNRMLLICCTIIRLLCRQGKPVSLENPTSSRMFICGCLTRLIHKWSGSVVKTVCCAFGTPWMKATSFCVWNLPQAQALHRKCARFDSCCQYSGIPHQVLQGNGPGGVPWTRIAQAYPAKLCGTYARLACSLHLGAFVHRLEQLGE